MNWITFGWNIAAVNEIVCKGLFCFGWIYLQQFANQSLKFWGLLLPIVLLKSSSGISLQHLMKFLLPNSLHHSFSISYFLLLLRFPVISSFHRIIQKCHDYAANFSKIKVRQAVLDLRSTLEKIGEIKEFEVCCLVNLFPRTLDEAKVRLASISELTCVKKSFQRLRCTSL